MAFNLSRLKRMRGNRRRVIPLRMLKPAPADRARLEAILAEMVEVVFAFSPELMAILRRNYTGDSAASDIDRIATLIVTATSAAAVRLQLRLRRWALRAEARHRQQFREAVLVATGVDPSTVLDPTDVTETVEAAVVRTVNLIRDIGDEARRKIVDIVIGAVTNRTPPRDVAGQIAEVAGMSRRRARNIAIDQSNKLHAALDRARQEEAGIEHFKWRHSGKLHYRPEHKAREGVIYKWKAGDGPGRNPPKDLPGMLPFCGCVAQAVIIDTEDDPTEESIQVDLEDAA